MNTAGGFRTQSDGIAPLSYTQTGGVVTTCTIPGSGPCFFIKRVNIGDTFALLGGEIVIQNAGSSSIDSNISMNGANTVIRFGNEFTVQPSTFNLVGDEYPNIVIDTRAGAHTLRLPHTDFETQVKTFEIGAGGQIEMDGGRLGITGEYGINNGTIGTRGALPHIVWHGQDPVYSGNGGTEGPIIMSVICSSSLTLSQVNNLRVRAIGLESGTLINSHKLTLGNNDSTENSISLNLGALDSAPVFELGSGGQEVLYTGNGPDRSTGVEINPSRVLSRFYYRNLRTGARLTIEGGNLTVGTLDLVEGEVATGQYKIVHTGGIRAFSSDGFVNGELERLYTISDFYTFLFSNGDIRAYIFTHDGPPRSLSIRNMPGPLPGLLPAASLSQHWQITESGQLDGQLTFFYKQEDVRGNESNYQIWRRVGGNSPAVIPFLTRNPNSHMIETGFGQTGFTGLWGIGEMVDPGPVSVSGSVLTSGGAGIRNAVVTITGGNLPAPVTTQTGQFGTYSFGGLQAGEVYTVRVDAKRFRFSPNSRQVTPFTDLAGVNFTANPQE